MNRKTPPATAALIAINLALFAVGAIDDAQRVWLVERFSLFAPAVLEGAVWRLFTATFLHANLFHIAMNMFALWQLGSLAEPVFGTRRFLGIYAAAGILGFGVSMLAKALFYSDVVEADRGVDVLFGLIPSLGASGAILGIDGALLGLIWLRARPGEFGQDPFVRNAMFNFFLLFAVGISGALPLDNYAHFGGALAGAALAILLVPRAARFADAPKKRRLAIAALAAVVGATLYSAYPVGTPGFRAVANSRAFDTGLEAMKRGDFAGCAAAFEEVVGRDPEDVHAAYGLVECRRGLGDAAGAYGLAKEYEALLDRRPGLETSKIKASSFREIREALEPAPKD